ncbi:hypothetical protein HKX48_007518 [Thoreauomyces humboldtii]|nr:hypothetical protein HKX48_007518 [Thoreauomyces humboldtii]
MSRGNWKMCVNPWSERSNRAQDDFTRLNARIEEIRSRLYSESSADPNAVWDLLTHGEEQNIRSNACSVLERLTWNDIHKVIELMRRSLEPNRAARRIHRLIRYLFDTNKRKPGAREWNHLLSLYLESPGRQLYRAMQLIERMEERGTRRRNAHTWFLLYQAASQARDPAEMAWVTDGIIADTRNLTSRFIKKLLGLHAAARDIFGAERLFDALCTSAIPLSPQSYMQFLIIASRLRDNVFARFVLERMRDLGLKPDFRMLNTALSASDKVAADFDALISQILASGTPPNVVTLTILLRQILGKSSDCGETASRLIDWIINESGVELDRTFFSVLIDFFARQPQPKEALAILQLMGKRGIPPDASTYGAVAAGLLVQNEDALAEDVLRQMIDAGMQPDKFCMTKLLDGYLKRGDFDAAMNIVDNMGTDEKPPPSIKADSYVMGMFLAAFARANDPQQGLQVFLQLQQRGVPADAAAYTQLLYLFKYDASVLTELWARMKQGTRTSPPVIPDIRVFRAYLEGILHQMPPNWDLAYSVLEELRASGLRPDAEMYDPLVTARGHARDIRGCRHLYAEMRSAGIVPTTWSFNQLLRAVARDDHVGFSTRELFDKELANGMTMDDYSYSIIIGKCLDRCDRDLALAYQSQAADAGVTLSKPTLERLQPQQPYESRQIQPSKSLQRNIDNLEKLLSSFIQIRAPPNSLVVPTYPPSETPAVVESNSPPRYQRATTPKSKIPSSPSDTLPCPPTAVSYDLSGDPRQLRSRQSKRSRKDHGLKDGHR